MEFSNCVGIQIVVLFSVISSCLCVICYNQPDGIYEENCKAFTKCQGGEEVITTCGQGQAYNTKTHVCQDKWNVPPPCGTYRDCADKNDGDYADPETQCGSFYTCANGYFYGHSLCPTGLVFNEAKQVCDFKFNVIPPCGTFNMTRLP